MNSYIGRALQGDCGSHAVVMANAVSECPMWLVFLAYCNPPLGSALLTSMMLRGSPRLGLLLAHRIMDACGEQYMARTIEKIALDSAEGLHHYYGGPFQAIPLSVQKREIARFHTTHTYIFKMSYVYINRRLSRKSAAT